MVETESNIKKPIAPLLLVGGVIAGLTVAAALLLSSPSPKTPPQAAATVQPAQTEPAATAEVNPVPSSTTTAEAVDPEDDALKDKLLGIDRAADARLAARLAARAARAAAAARNRRPVADGSDAQARRRDPADDEGAALQASDGISDAEFHGAIERWRGVKSCLGEHKGRATGSRGALRLAMTITGSGDVVDSKVYDEGNEVARLIAPCVEKQARQIKFPSHESGKPVVREAKFVF